MEHSESGVLCVLPSDFQSVDVLCGPEEREREDNHVHENSTLHYTLYSREPAIFSVYILIVHAHKRAGSGDTTHTAQ